MPIPAVADLPFVTFFGSDLAKMKGFKWNGSFLVDRLVSLSAAGFKDVTPIRTSTVCQLWVPEGRNGAVLLAIIISLKWAWKLLGESSVHRNVMLSLLLASSPVPSPWICSLPIGRHHPIRTDEQTGPRGCRGEVTEASHREEEPFQGQHCVPFLAFHPTGLVSHLWMLDFPCFLQNWTELTIFRAL